MWSKMTGLPSFDWESSCNRRVEAICPLVVKSNTAGQGHARDSMFYLMWRRGLHTHTHTCINEEAFTVWRLSLILGSIIMRNISTGWEKETSDHFRLETEASTAGRNTKNKQKTSWTTTTLPFSLTPLLLFWQKAISCITVLNDDAMKTVGRAAKPCNINIIIQTTGHSSRQVRSGVYVESAHNNYFHT